VLDGASLDLVGKGHREFGMTSFYADFHQGVSNGECLERRSPHSGESAWAWRGPASFSRFFARGRRDVKVA
jgi:hypothetical protein